MRKIVIFTLSFPVGLLLFYTIFTRVYIPDSIPGDYLFDEQELELTAADGAQLAATAVRVQQSAGDVRPLVVFVAERSLDRDWNSRSFSFRTGERLAAILGGAGNHSLRFDHRGTGDTQSSPSTRLDPGLMATDITSVLRAGRKHIYSKANDKTPIFGDTYYLAHASACALTLSAIEQDLKKQDTAQISTGVEPVLPTGVILLSCDASGTLLDQWGRKLLFNMERQGVDSEIVTRAGEEWRAFVENGRLPENEIAPAAKPSPDLIAFREAVRYMASQEMDRFRQTAAAMDLQKLIRAIVRRGIPVLHLIGTMDEELPRSAIHDASRLARSLQTAGPYAFQFIPAMNHFLKEQTEDLQGPGLALERMNPFRKIQPVVVRIIREFIERNSPTRPPMTIQVLPPQ